MGARPRRAASLRGERKALLRACPANVPEAGEIIEKEFNIAIILYLAGREF